MKFIPTTTGGGVLEITEYNLRVLLAKLKDPTSARTISKLAEDDSCVIVVKAVPDSEHYSDRAPGEMAHEPEFDVEEYRADLERRLASLEGMGNQYWEKHKIGHRNSDLIDSERCKHKADGVKIALSLLPKKA